MAHDSTRVYQHGTLALLVPGLFTGTQSVHDLLQHGDFGIGTAHGLAGELIVLDGQAYLVAGTGDVRPVKTTETVPFATVHFQDAALTSQTISGITKMALEQQLLNQAPLKNLFFAVKITGQFKKMHTRAVEAQVEPYPNLTAATRVQPEFTAEMVEGTLVGYYAPALYQGAAVAGYHVHFLNTAHDFGGHVLDYEVADAQLTVQPFETFEQHFPNQNAAFLETDFDLHAVNADIEEAEH